MVPMIDVCKFLIQLKSQIVQLSCLVTSFVQIKTTATKKTTFQYHYQPLHTYSCTVTDILYLFKLYDCEVSAEEIYIFNVPCREHLSNHF